MPMLKSGSLAGRESTSLSAAAAQPAALMELLLYMSECIHRRMLSNCPQVLRATCTKFKGGHVAVAFSISFDLK